MNTQNLASRYLQVGKSSFCFVLFYFTCSFLSSVSIKLQLALSSLLTEEPDFKAIPDGRPIVKTLKTIRHLALNRSAQWDFQNSRSV